MKKLKCVLLSVCLLGTMFSFTGCGESAGSNKEWQFYDDTEEENGIHVSNRECEYIISEAKAKSIAKSLRDMYIDVKPVVENGSIKGLLKDDLVMEGKYKEVEMIRSEELDSIFSAGEHTVETYVNVDFSGGLNYVYMNYEIYAEYDNDEDSYCLAEIYFELPGFSLI